MEIDNILDYDGLVYSIIGKYDSYNREDLYQVGMLGLIEAYKNYKPDMGAKFSTYAYLYIIGEVTKYIRESKGLRVSRDTIRLIKSLEKGRELLRQKLAREPSDYELSVFLEIDMKTISKANDAMFNILSLDNLGEDDNTSYYDSIKVYDNRIDSDVIDLESAINTLSDDDKKIIYDRYYNGYTQSEISNDLGISQVQVSRKEAKILQKLKVKL